MKIKLIILSAIIASTAAAQHYPYGGDQVGRERIMTLNGERWVIDPPVVTIKTIDSQVATVNALIMSPEAVRATATSLAIAISDSILKERIRKQKRTCKCICKQ